MSLSEWFRTAARDRLQNQQRSDPFESSADLDAFFRMCDELEGPKVEPDREEHWVVRLDVHSNRLFAGRE